MVDPLDERLIFANHATQALTGESSLSALRFGPLSACTQTRLSLYLNDLQHQHEIVEIWTLASTAGELARHCRLTLATFPGLAPVILFEGANIPHAATENIDEHFKRVDKALYQAKHHGRSRVLVA